MPAYTSKKRCPAGSTHLKTINGKYGKVRKCETPDEKATRKRRAARKPTHPYQKGPSERCKKGYKQAASAGPGRRMCNPKLW